MNEFRAKRYLVFVVENYDHTMMPSDNLKLATNDIDEAVSLANEYNSVEGTYNDYQAEVIDTWKWVVLADIEPDNKNWSGINVTLGKTKPAI